MLRNLFDTLANMGVWIRLNDPRHEPVSDAGRVWGEIQEDFAISLQALSPDTLSVLMKNFGPARKIADIPGWLSYFKVTILGLEGWTASLKSYGQQVLLDPQNTAPVQRVFDPGRFISTEIPISALYNLPRGQYQVFVSCLVPGSPASVISSNVLTMPFAERSKL